MVMSGIIIAYPQPVAAQLHNIFPADDFGIPISFLNVDDNLYVTATSDTKDGRICVVATDTVLSGTESVNCDSSIA